MPRITRRHILAGSATIGAAIGTGLSFRQARAQANPIRIGFIAPLSGPGAPVGNPIRLGAEAARDHVNKAGGIMGRPIELVILDDRTNPNDGVAAVRELNSQGINLVLGPPNTAVVFAAIPIYPELKMVGMISASPDEKITHDIFNRNVFTLAPNGYTRLHAIARVMVQKYPGITDWTGATPDNAAGRNGWSAFMRAINDEYTKGGKGTPRFHDPAIAKFGATDFKNQLSQLMASPATGMFTNEFGADGMTFFQQSAAFGLAKKFKTIVEYAIDIDLPKSLKRNVPSNIWAISYWHYAAHMQNPLAQELVAASKAGGDPYPHAFTALGHSGIMGYAGAIQAVQGTGTDNVIAALEGLKFDSVRGPTVFRREDHQAISSQNIVRWEPTEAEPGWKSAEFVTVSDVDVVNPPAPGTKWVD